MTSDLRKAHKMIWVVLAILIPILLVSAVLGIPKPAFNDKDLLVNDGVDKEPPVYEDESLTLFLEQDGAEGNLRLFLKKPLPHPSALVYANSSKTPEGTYLGSLDKKGVYQFTVDRSAEEIKIYDAIKKEEITKIALSWD